MNSKLVRTVGIYTERVECVTYTLAQSLSLGDYQVVLVTDEQFADNQHQLYLQKIRQISGVRVLNINGEPNLAIDVLYIEILHNFSRKKLFKWSKVAKSMGAISYAQKSSLHSNYISQLKEVIKYFPVSLRLRNIGVLDGFHRFDLYSFLSSRYNFGFDVHSKFLEDKQLNSLMFSFNWEPHLRRKYKLNYLGNILPKKRTQILQKLKDNLNIVENSKIPEALTCSDDNVVFWLEYDDSTPTDQRGLSPESYIECLSNSDFTLCPPGYSRLTHRTVEALIRGSIPILDEDELDLYDMKLCDGENCIAVRKHDWISSVQRILALSTPKLIQMRCNIMAMKEEYLLPEVNAKRLRHKMGLD